MCISCPELKLHSIRLVVLTGLLTAWDGELTGVRGGGGGRGVEYRLLTHPPHFPGLYVLLLSTVGSVHSFSEDLQGSTSSLVLRGKGEKGDSGTQTAKTRELEWRRDNRGLALAVTGTGQDRAGSGSTPEA